MNGASAVSGEKEMTCWLANPDVQMSEGIQNVIFNLMNTSVVWFLQHPELNDPCLPKAQ